MSKFKIYFLCGIIFSLAVNSCKEDISETLQNNQPVIQSITADSIFIPPFSTIKLTCTATDKDNDELIYYWSSTKGSFPDGQTGTSIRWLSPYSSGQDTIRVTVNDRKNPAIGIIIINVGNPPSQTYVIRPINASINVSLAPVLSWGGAYGVSHTLQVSNVNDFSTLIYEKSGLTNNYDQVTGLTTNIKYYWRVKSSNSFGTSYSPVYYFTTYNNPCPGMPTFSYGGKIYNTVQIGSQCWMKDNLDIGTMITTDKSMTNNGIIEKYCYYDDPAYCASFGALYNWDEAMSYDTIPGIRGICPPDWHLPTAAEFNTLLASVGNDENSLKEVGQGSGAGAGTNTSGFSFLLDGYHMDVTYYDVMNRGYLWTSSHLVKGVPYAFFFSASDNYFEQIHLLKPMGYNIRCIKN